MEDAVRFCDADAFALALSAGIVPQEIAGAPAQGAVCSDALWIRPELPLEPGVRQGLSRLGATFHGPAEQPLLAQVLTCWIQLLAPATEAVDRLPTADTAVLLVLPDQAMLADVVGEILRQGNDRMSYRWLTDGSAGQALLRIVGPPYYTLLRAVDPEPGATGPALTAYVEQSRGVWVEYGHRQPLCECIVPPPGALLLIRRNGMWATVDDAPFRDVYQMLEISGATASITWRAAELETRFRVPLQLVPASGDDAPQLWILRGEELVELDAWVQDADPALLERLAFAVGERAQGRTIAVRARRSRAPPPVVVLPGLACRPYLRLPNLFVPCGTRIHPPLRRDALAKHLALQPSDVVWLAPGKEGRFCVERFADSAFHPLADWVDYIVDEHGTALSAWVNSAFFQFKSFVVERPDAAAAKSPKTTTRTSPPKPQVAPMRQRPSPPTPAPASAQQPEPEAQERPYSDDVPIRPAPTVSTAETARARLREVEAEFLAGKLPLDAAELRPLWQEMAEMHGVLGATEQAALCLLGAQWDLERPDPALVDAWRGAELAGAKLTKLGDVTAWELMATETLPASKTRSVVAHVCRLAGRATLPVLAAAHLATYKRFLERQESSLPIRAVWLGWLAFVRLAGGDVLSLAQARDRQLARLFQGGLRPLLDLPDFLRLGAGGESAREVMCSAWQLAGDWLEREGLERAPTQAYMDLVFAVGLARTGDNVLAQEALTRARDRLPSGDPVHAWLLAAYEHRIDQARAAESGASPLPWRVLAQLPAMEKRDRYKIDRLRQHSRILEPFAKIDPYRHLQRPGAVDPTERALAALYDLADPVEVRAGLAPLLRSVTGNPDITGAVRVLATALELAPRVGEAFAAELLTLTLGRIEEAEPLERCLLLERGLFLAAHFDQRERIDACIEQFYALLEVHRAPEALAQLEPAFAETFRSLRLLGLQTEASRLLTDMDTLVHAALRRSPGHGRVRGAYGASAVVRGGVGVRASLVRILAHVGAGRYHNGQPDLAGAVLDEAWALLDTGGLVDLDRIAAVQACAEAAANAPPTEAQQRVRTLLALLTGVGDTFTTNSHFSISHLDVIETLVLALAKNQPQAAVGEAGRRWHEEDELLVRRRIHRDMRLALDAETT